MAFGSGHKIVELFTYRGVRLAKLVFGEHPLVLKLWTISDIYFDVPLKYNKTDEYIRYVTSWAQRNTQLGHYNLHYTICFADGREIKIEVQDTEINN